jgi:hypothetical protein
MILILYQYLPGGNMANKKKCVKVSPSQHLKWGISKFEADVHIQVKHVTILLLVGECKITGFTVL